MLKVAVVHEWLQFYGGAERVLAEVLDLFPEADLYCLLDFLPPEQRGFLKGRAVATSFIQKLPLARKRYRSYLPLMPLAVEQFDLTGYDLVISSSHAAAKGVITGPDQLHLSICYTPARYVWDQQHSYLRQSGLDKGLKGGAARLMLHRFRIWDCCTANRVDDFVAISNYIARRIWKAYRREATVIYPPVDTDLFFLHHAGNGDKEREDFYLTLSRLVPYKRIDLIVEAFSRLPHKKLVVIGEGPEEKRIRLKAGPNIIFLGYQPLAVVRKMMQKTRAFVFAAEEDFGIAPLEAQACGTPVIAFGRGGAVETIRGQDEEKMTGVLFYRQDIDALLEAIAFYEQLAKEISPQNCRQNALRFSREVFQNNFKAHVDTRFNSYFKGSEKDNYTLKLAQYSRQKPLRRGVPGDGS